MCATARTSQSKSSSPIELPNKSHLPILPNPEPNIPVKGIACNTIAGEISVQFLYVMVAFIPLPTIF